MKDVDISGGDQDKDAGMLRMRPGKWKVLHCAHSQPGGSD